MPRKVHLRQTPRGVVCFLAVDGNVAELAAVCFDKFLARHKHSAGTAAGIVNASLVWREHLHQHTHHPGRRIELSALLALGAGKLGKEVFVDAAENVLGAISGAAESDIAHK